MDNGCVYLITSSYSESVVSLEKINASPVKDVNSEIEFSVNEMKKESSIPICNLTTLPLSPLKPRIFRILDILKVFLLWSQRVKIYFEKALRKVCLPLLGNVMSCHSECEAPDFFSLCNFSLLIHLNAFFCCS